MTTTDDLLSIDTPENVVFGYELAGIGSRFMATIIDTFFIVILEIIISLTFFFIIFKVGGTSKVGAWILAFMILLIFSFLVGYYIFFEMLWNGQTPGKRWIGLRVIRYDGKPIGLVESIIRNLVRLIDFLPGAYSGGVLVMFLNSQSRRLGDMAAGTLVIYDQAQVTLESLAPAGNKPQDLILQNLAVDKLTHQDILLAENFGQRQRELKNGDALGRQLVHFLGQKMELDEQPLSDSQIRAFLQAIANHTPS